ncbi:PAS domain-containing sensor histidine kinase [Ktedonosporobacter rubrisoli]|nr:PAS domain-containing sensor histidine kinase [Ktedonosporobacter rubrisoli]
MPTQSTDDQNTYIPPDASSNGTTTSGENATLAAFPQEGLLELAIQAAGAGLWDWDLLNNHLTWSDQCKKLFGLPPDREMSFEVFVNTLHPDDLPVMDQALIESLVQRAEYNVEYRVIWPDKSVHWIDARGRAIYNPQGDPIRMVGIALDITSQKYAEELEQENTKKIQAIFESVTDAVVLVDSEWRITYMNSQAEQLFRANFTQAAGQTLWHVFPALYDTIFGERYREAMRKRQPDRIEAMYEPRGLWYEVRVYPLKDGSLALYTNNISEQKRVEAELRASELQFHRLVDSNIIGVFIGDIHGQIFEANEAFLSLLGFKKEDLAQGLRWDTLTPAEYEAGDQHAIGEMLEKGFCTPFEKEHITKNGKRVPVLAGAAMLQHPPDRFIGFVLDISSQKTLERQKDVFISMAGHELRTPLTAIKTSLQLMNRRLLRIKEELLKSTPTTSNTLEAVFTLLARSLRQIEVQNRLINDLVDVSRIAADKLVLTPKLCNLSEIVSTAIEDLQATDPDRKFILSLPQDQAILVVADADRIGQVVNNYVTNALKYSPDDRPITVGLQAEGADARVWVKDAGPGLSKEAQKHIWERFYQVKGVHTQNGGGIGLGLGLYICKTLIMLQHGTVGVDSTPGEGSSFWFTLPLAKVE